jgi:putative SOS response-associated peptidase YedK
MTPREPRATLDRLDLSAAEAGHLLRVHRATGLPLARRLHIGADRVPIVVELLLRLMARRGIRPAEVTASRHGQTSAKRRSGRSQAKSAKPDRREGLLLRSSSSFSENETLPNGSKPPVWFAFDETRPLACFAGICTRWTSVRKVKEGETTNDIFGFITTEPNKEVGAIHPKAMPVILKTRQEIDLWMTAPAEGALKLQWPLADGALMIVARGEKTDEGGLAA